MAWLALTDSSRPAEGDSFWNPFFSSPLVHLQRNIPHATSFFGVCIAKSLSAFDPFFIVSRGAPLAKAHDDSVLLQRVSSYWSRLCRGCIHSLLIGSNAIAIYEAVAEKPPQLACGAGTGAENCVKLSLWQIVEF